MKKILSATAVLIAGTSGALAHPGDHAYSAFQSVLHVLTEPDHLAMMVGAIVLAVGLYVRSKKRA
jgi:hydrogenase/urease accessory protein HupE